MTEFACRHSIKLRAPRIATLVGLLLVGCDRLPESITGRPDPNAARMVPVGPSGSNAIGGIAGGSESGVLDATFVSSEIAPSPFGNPIPAANTSNDELFAPAVRPTAGTDTFPTTLGSNPASGLQVPSVDNVSPSADGKIYIDSAHLKFVDDHEMAAPADGLIMQMVADEGDVVEANSLMIQLDDRLANSELAVTKKELEAATEKAKDDSEILFSKASLDVAREDYKIALEIDRKGAGTASELSKRWLEFRKSELAVKVSEVKNKQDLLAVGVSEAKQGAADVQVTMRKMVAPFDGVVAEKRKHMHEWVRAGDVILRLVSMEQLRVVGQVRVSQLSAAPHELVGAPANIDIELFPGRTERVTAKVGFVSPVMESSGGYRIWLQIPNIKSKNQWVFREGMPAKIEIATR